MFKVIFIIIKHDFVYIEYKYNYCYLILCKITIIVFIFNIGKFQFGNYI